MLPPYKRVAIDHYLLCYVIDRRDQMLAGLPGDDMRHFSSNLRLGWLMFMAHSILRQHGCDLRFDAVFEHSEKHVALPSFFRSETIRRIVDQCTRTGWIEHDEDSKIFHLTNDGREIVLEVSSRYLAIPWTNTIDSDGCLSVPQEIVRVDDPRVDEVLRVKLTPLFMIPIDHLQNQLLHEAVGITHGWSMCSSMEPLKK